MAQARPRTTIGVTRVGVPDWLALAVGVLRVDGERAGLLVGGKTRVVHVAPGARSVTVQMGPTRSPAEVVRLRAGEHADLICGWEPIPPGAERTVGTGRIAVGAGLVGVGLGLLFLPVLFLTSPWANYLAYRFIEAFPALDEWVIERFRYGGRVLAAGVLSMGLGLVLAGVGFRWYLWKNRRVWLLRRPAPASVAPAASPLDPSPDDPPPGPLTNLCVLAAIEARKATAGLRRADDEGEGVAAPPPAQAAEAPESA